jgi:hypothetical protein
MSEDRFEYELAKVLIDARRSGITGARISDALHRALSKDWYG